MRVKGLDLPFTDYNKGRVGSAPHLGTTVVLTSGWLFGLACPEVVRREALAPHPSSAMW